MSWKTLETKLKQTYWVVRAERNGFFMHVSGIHFRWTCTPYDASFFESQEDAERYLDVADWGEHDGSEIRIVSMTMSFESPYERDDILEEAAAHLDAHRNERVLLEQQASYAGERVQDISGRPESSAIEWAVARVRSLKYR